ncbi:coiled-coil domain-containing protein 190 [Hyla sarda]|uniref:coiled-coil domain-containing protein 190 n=1 Tax=Hyla sarda TaxID=327740 RepID=UPI0024C348E6|nr:coiled-coil domain-containing protein 190 [Hyla sarda]
MQRSRPLGNSTDRQWEAERRGAKRAEARLNNGIQEIEGAQQYHMNSMTKEQKRLQKDLARIKQATVKKTSSNSATNMGKRGQLAATSAGPVMASGSSMTLQMRINDFMDGVKKGKAETESSPSGPNITEIKTSSSRRSSIVSVTGDLPGKPSGLLSNTNDKPIGSANAPFPRQRRGSLFKDKPAFDEEIYAPDGGLRTLHTMPDFMDSFEEAKNARYIRHRVKPESEMELSVDEIFEKEDSGGFTEDETMDSAMKTI